MRSTGAVYVKAGGYEVTLGPEPFQPEPEQPKAEFVHDGEEAAPSRRNKLLDHPALRRR